MLTLYQHFVKKFLIFINAFQRIMKNHFLHCHKIVMNANQKNDYVFESFFNYYNAILSHAKKIATKMES